MGPSHGNVNDHKEVAEQLQASASFLFYLLAATSWNPLQNVTFLSAARALLVKPLFMLRQNCRHVPFLARDHAWDKAGDKAQHGPAQQFDGGG